MEFSPVEIEPGPFLQKDSILIYFRDILPECSLLSCICDALQPHLTQRVKHNPNAPPRKPPRAIFISSILVRICDISTHFRIQSKPQLRGEQKWHALYGKFNCPCLSSTSSSSPVKPVRNEWILMAHLPPP